MFKQLPLTSYMIILSINYNKMILFKERTKEGKKHSSPKAIYNNRNSANYGMKNVHRFQKVSWLFCKKKK